MKSLKNLEVIRTKIVKKWLYSARFTSTSTNEINRWANALLNKGVFDWMTTFSCFDQRDKL